MRTSSKKSKKAAKNTVLDSARVDFLKLLPVIGELKARLKEEKKKMKEIYATIQEHMVTNELETLDMEGYVFERSMIERCPFNEKNLSEIIEDQSILEQYREKFSESTSRFRMHKNA